MSLKYTQKIRERFSGFNQFYHDVFKMSLGIFASQLIQAIFLPIIVHFYTPSQFAIYNFFITAATLLGLIATARLEFAIVVENAKNIVNIIVTPIALSILSCFFIVVVVQAYKDEISTILQGKDIHSEIILQLIPYMAMLVGMGQIFSNISNRFCQYGQLAVGTIFFQLIFAIFAICLGLYSEADDGLIIARTIAQAALIIIFIFQIKPLTSKFGILDRKNVIKSLVKNYRFTLYGLPYSIIHTFSKEFILFVLISFGHLEVAGLFSFVRNLMLAPTTFIGASIGKVYYKEAADSIGTPKLQKLTMKLMYNIIAVFAPSLVFFMFWAPELFREVLNVSWSKGGIYAAFLVPSTLLYLLSSWTDKLFEVTGSQKLSLTIQIVSDVLLIILALFLLISGVSPEICCKTYSLLLCIYHAVYLYMIFKISNFNIIEYWQVMNRMVVLSFLFVIAFYGVDLSFESTILKLFIDAIILCIYLFVWLRREFFPYKIQSMINEVKI